MATKVIMPALGMAQDSGILTAWLKQDGELVAVGEPLMEVETDKTTVEVEAPATGILTGITAQPGDKVPVAQIIAWILAEGEELPEGANEFAANLVPEQVAASRHSPLASPVATRIAADHDVDLRLVKSKGNRITKDDVLAYIATRGESGSDGKPLEQVSTLLPASPKARRLAKERGIDLAAIGGNGPAGAVLTSDVLAVDIVDAGPAAESIQPSQLTPLPISNAWRVMAERISQNWITTPHFYLMREVDASNLLAWHQAANNRSAENITITDLLVKLVATALREHPRLNASWIDDGIYLSEEVNVGLAVATEDALLVPVIHHADRITVAEIAKKRQGIVSRAKAGRQKLEDLQGGTFTISNLGMYGVDAFNAIVNPPQAAILAVGRIADQVVPVDNKPAIRPMMILTLSSDHRVVDGARAAQFLDLVVNLLEEPLAIL